MEPIVMTHKGWFVICPVYLGDIDSEAPFVEPRHKMLTPLWIISEVLCAVGMWLSGNYVFPFRITGERRLNHQP